VASITSIRAILATKWNSLQMVVLPTAIPPPDIRYNRGLSKLPTCSRNHGRQAGFPFFPASIIKFSRQAAEIA
jgi:hypothetical protein